jgi:aspartate racemase
VYDRRGPMKRLGILGGLGPESTIEYYRAALAATREAGPPAASAPLLINSVDLPTVRRLVTDGAYEELIDYLVRELDVLARAGVTLALIAANTPHIVFEEVRDRAAVPLLSIVDAACEASRAAGYTRVGLLGTRFTMEGRFYPETFARAGIDIVVPAEEERAYVHQKYLDELIDGILLPATRDGLLQVVQHLAGDGVEAVILAGTELPLILTGQHAAGTPLLDTTKIHVRAAVDALWHTTG